VAAGQHPDCQVLAPTLPRDNPRGAAALRIEQVRDLEHWAALAPLAAPRKVFILDDADRMTLPTAQALLKTLEEPPPRTLLVLVVANPGALPPTVLSRCQRVRFRPLTESVAAALLEARGVDPGDSRLLARLSQGQIGPALTTDLATARTRRETALALTAVPAVRIGLALDQAGLERPDRATVAALLETLWLWYRDALVLAAGGPGTLLVNGDCGDDIAALAGRATPAGLAAALAGIKEAWLALDSNVGPRLALEQALLAAAEMTIRARAA
jgi:DNA polymerase-3 subunit delta'